MCGFHLLVRAWIFSPCAHLVKQADVVSRCLSVGLEDSTTGTVAEAVVSVLRGCLEHMPKGEQTQLHATQQVFAVANPLL